MELNDESLAYVRHIFLSVLSPQQTIRKEAENQLNQLELQSNFSMVILSLINNLSSTSPVSEDASIRQSASVYFKNYIKKFWSEDGNDDADDSTKGRIICDADKENIKQYIIDLMCQVPKEIQYQLSEAIAIIAKYDFPSKWLTLLPMLSNKLQSNPYDLHVIYGILVTANSIMKRFRNTHQSDELFEELLYCLKNFQEILTQMLLKTSELFAMHAGNGNNLEDVVRILEILRLIVRIFYSLNWQDIPEYFEDNLNVWMPQFATYLTYENAAVTSGAGGSSSDPLEAGPIEKLKTGIIENLILYATKYEEMFTPYLGQFTELLWQLLVSTPSEPKYDQLTTVAIKYLTTISSKQMNSHLFTDEILRQIIEQIIVPNLMATDNDEELFHENPSDYIRKDMEGSDQDTRRRAACDFIRSLLKNFRSKTTEICITYIDGLLQQYTSGSNTAAAATKKNWRLKDGALHLVLASSILSTTLSHGAGTLNPEMNILSILQTHILPEIHSPIGSTHPIVKADAIKLVCTFRSHFPVEFLLELLPHLIRYLSSEDIVIQTYAALCIEKFLTVKNDPITASSGSGSGNNSSGSGNGSGGGMKLNKEVLLPMINQLFSSLFAVLENDDLPENDYVMKCIMRLLTVIGSDIKPITELVLNHLTVSLERICKNPANPFFNHYLFECIALLVRSCCSPSALSSLNSSQQMEILTQFETLLFPLFQTILQMDVIEFIPYVFQILAQLLSYRPIGTGLSDAYRELFPPLLSPSLWLRKGNIPALTDLILAYIYQGINEIIATNLLEGVLGIYQKLLASRSSEPFAFKIICALIRSISTEHLSPYLPMILQLMLIRLQENRTPQLSKLFIHFLCVIAYSPHGAAYIFNVLESLQSSMTTMIITDIWAPTADVISHADSVEFNQIILGGLQFLVDSPVFDDSRTWIELFKILLHLLSESSASSTSARKPSIDITQLLDDDTESREFDSTYSKLAYAQIIEVLDPVLEGGGPDQMRAKFGEKLSQLCKGSPGKYSNLLRSQLSSEQQQMLQEIIAETGCQIV